MIEKNNQIFQISQIKKKKSHKIIIIRKFIIQEFIFISAILIYAANNFQNELTRIIFKYDIHRKK